ncbi:MAG TPA: hypothetical protein VG936_12715 [Lacunisphaera sp.]|nr:hypothetical protein [Lacunisphaera sp.]
MTTLASWLHLPQGDAYQRLYAFLPWWALGSLVLVGIALGSWRLLQPRLLPARPSIVTRGTGATFGALAALAIFMVVACDGLALSQGFFRQDDFSFLQVTRETPAVSQQMLLVHNDHLCPLYRLEFAVLAGLAGPDASTATLAAWFRACTFATCVGLLLAGAWVLHESGSSRLGLLSFVYFLWLWPGWGEFTAGYFSCTNFLQILALGFCAAAAMLRGFNQGSAAWLALSLLLVAGAAGFDVSALNIFVTLGVLAAGRTWSMRGHAAPWWYLLGLVALFGTALLFYFLIVRHAPTPREFVQNPHGGALRISTLFANLRQHPLGVVLTCLAAPGGLLLSLITPTFLQFVVVEDRVGPMLFWGCFLASLVVLTAAVAGIAKVARRLAGLDRQLFVAMTANALLSLGMVVAARVDVALHVPVPLWPVRYLMVPVAWAMLAILLAADRLWFSHPSPSPRFPAWYGAAIVAGAWFVVSCWALEKSVLPQPLSYVARGRWGNLKSAQARAGQYAAVIADLTAISRQEGGGTIVLPEPDRWSAGFFARYSALEWGSDYTARGVTYLFWDLPSAAPNLNLRGRWAPAGSFAPETRALLSRYVWLRPAFESVEERDAPSR